MIDCVKVLMFLTFCARVQGAAAECEGQAPATRLQHRDVRLEEVRLHARTQEANREEARVCPTLPPTRSCSDPLTSRHHVLMSAAIMKFLR